jgi:hypothetical protein
MKPKVGETCIRLNERTEMAKKISIKRIALVAVSTLGFGLLSMVPAKAAFDGTVVINDLTLANSSVKTVVGVSAETIFSIDAETLALDEWINYQINVASAPSGSALANADELVTGLVGADGDSAAIGTYKFVTGEDAVVADVTQSLTNLTDGEGTTVVNGGLIDTADDAVAAIDAVRGKVSINPDIPGTYVVEVRAFPYDADDEVGEDWVQATFTVTAVSTSPAGSNNWSINGILDCETGYSTTDGVSTGCVGVVGGRVVVDVTANALANRGVVPDYYLEVSGATIVSLNTTTGGDDIDFGFGSNVLNATTTTLDWPGAGNLSADADGIVAIHTDGTPAAAGEESITITKSDAGTTIVKIYYFDASGTKITFETHNITWIAAADGAVSATESSISTISYAADSACDGTESLGTTTAAFKATLAAVAKAKMDSADANGGVAQLCIVARDGAGRPMQNVDVEASISKGNLDDAGSFDSTSSRETITDMDYNGVLEILGDDDEVGVATITVTLTDSYDNEATLTGTFTFYGDIATVELTNNSYSLAASGADADAIYLVAKDALGTTIPLDEAGNGFSVDAGDLLVDSDIADISTNADAKGEEDAAATVTLADLNSDTAGVEAAEISVTCSALYSEKLSIKAYGTTDLATYVVSNAATYYCAGSASVVTITPAATTLTKSGSTTLQVTVVDAKGYPVADGTSVSLAATSGGTVAPSSKTTANGTFAVPATFLASDLDGVVTVSAISSNGKSASANITVGTGVANSAAIDAANAASDAAAEAIDAANAATDAANLAAEAADAATVAAEEARDAADAATAAVEALATEVATLMAALKAQITTLANTVAKIAKKVKA